MTLFQVILHLSGEMIQKSIRLIECSVHGKNNVRLLLKNGWVRAFDGHQQIAEGTIDVFASALSGTTSIFSFLLNAVRPRGFLWSKEIICATLP